jgi:copper(I)-binding protein
VVTFNPGGWHIMVVGLKQPLREGQTFPLTLNFEKAGKEDVIVSVAKVGATRPSDAGQTTHEHGDGTKK